ncbi:MAG: molybdopterin-binding protein, partial [Anaerolineae bacterium]
MTLLHACRLGLKLSVHAVLVQGHLDRGPQFLFLDRAGHVSVGGSALDVLLHLPDEKETIRKVLSEALKNYDALLLSGGVSAGKLDFVP